LVNVNTVPSQNVSFEVPHPSITGISPPEAPANGVITITGSGFGVSVRSGPSGHRCKRSPCSLSGHDFDCVHLERQWTLPLK
jgi:hypothetical protein